MVNLRAGPSLYPICWSRNVNWALDTGLILSLTHKIKRAGKWWRLQMVFGLVCECKAFWFGEVKDILSIQPIAHEMSTGPEIHLRYWTTWLVNGTDGMLEIPMQGLIPSRICSTNFLVSNQTLNSMWFLQKGGRVFKWVECGGQTQMWCYVGPCVRFFQDKRL